MATRAPMMPQDVVFRRALMALPQPLRVALTEAELDDPGLLRAYPRATAAQLGFDHAPPLDLRRRLTKKGGGGGGAAEATAATDTAVGTFAGVVGMYDVTTGGTGGGMAADGGSIPLSPITGSVPVASSTPHSPFSSFSPSFPSIFPIVPAEGTPEDGLETFTLRTARGSREAVSAVESKSSGADVKVIPSGTKLEEKMTARAGKKKKEQKAVSRAKVAIPKSGKQTEFASVSQGAENSRCPSHSSCQPDEFLPRVQALISAPPGGISLSFEPVENSRCVRHSSCQPDEFSPRSEALIREPTGGSDLSLESAAAGTASV